MAVQLDSDERARVEVRRLTNRPTYFDASSLQDTKVSSDFEAFLILQDDLTLSATITWQSAAVALSRSALDRKAVAFEALIVEQADVTAQLDEVEREAASFNLWKDRFRAGKFSDTPEVGLIIRDFQAEAEGLFTTESRLRHRRAVAAREQDRLRQGMTSAQLRELQSWPTPLLTY